MKPTSAVAAYQQSAARGASPVGLVVSLYDTVIRDFRRALAALEAGNVEARVFELNHALTVIAHLKSVLDHARGGQAAVRLSRFYSVTHAMILEANMSGSRATLLKLVDLYGSVRQAWRQAEAQLPSASATEEAPETAGGPSLPPAEETAPARGRWSA